MISAGSAKDSNSIGQEESKIASPIQEESKLIKDDADVQKAKVAKG